MRLYTLVFASDHAPRTVDLCTAWGIQSKG
jgi:hypothetical protein